MNQVGQDQHAESREDVPERRIGGAGGLRRRVENPVVDDVAQAVAVETQHRDRVDRGDRAEEPPNDWALRRRRTRAPHGKRSDERENHERRCRFGDLPDCAKGNETPTNESQRSAADALESVHDRGGNEQHEAGEQIPERSVGVSRRIRNRIEDAVVDDRGDGVVVEHGDAGNVHDTDGGEQFADDRTHGYTILLHCSLHTIPYGLLGSARRTGHTVWSAA